MPPRPLLAPFRDMSSMAPRIPSFLRRRRRLSSAIQLVGLRRLFPGSAGSVDKGRLKWSFDRFQGSPISRVYKIEIEGRPGEKPSVWLSGGAINAGNAVDAPHKYGIDDDGPRIKVCLDRFDWKSDQLYADTYVPWAMEWIAHFEIWCATGEWNGGGIHPPPR